MALEEGLGADRLGGLDVVLDDGAQDAQTTVLAHAPPPVRVLGRSHGGTGLALSPSECQSYVVRPRDAKVGTARRAALPTAPAGSG
ncbi:hypothetical protein GCM10012283_05730 [Phycicoccus endophyticus]|nr:hypothetical protein GCM10012283_05730 [Phycicoccus endophyticus]